MTVTDGIRPVYQTGTVLLAEEEADGFINKASPLMRLQQQSGVIRKTVVGRDGLLSVFQFLEPLHHTEGLIRIVGCPVERKDINV